MPTTLTLKNIPDELYARCTAKTSAEVHRRSLKGEAMKRGQAPFHIESLLAGAEYEVDSLGVFELVRDSACSAYDCEFVALAVRLDTHLVTMDKQLLRAFPNRAVALVAN